MTLLMAPTSVLFVCTLNATRSPMAAGLLRHLHGQRMWVKSAGIDAGPLDSFAIAAMDEIGIDISRHRPRRFDELDDTSFDLVIALSPEAHLFVEEATRRMACEVDFWDIPDPTLGEGTRESRLDAYREVRHLLLGRILRRFPPASAVFAAADGVMRPA